eukprot:2685229-Pyramimonas_sp.AAC.1
MNRCRHLLTLTRRFSSTSTQTGTSLHASADVPRGTCSMVNDALVAMGRGDTRTRRGKIFNKSNGKSRPKPGKEDKHKSWMQTPVNPLMPSFKLPKQPSANDIPFL